MNVWWQLGMGIAFLALIWYMIDKRLTSREPSAEVDGPGRHPPFSGVPAPKKRGPRSRSGAVALEEPDDEDGDRSYPPRNV